ncbi:MAG: aminopeptidase P family protein [Bacteroidota bacterium]
MFAKEVYSRRRARLMKNVQGGLILILGNNDSPMNYPANTYHFRQDSNFLYFFGLDLQGFAGVIDVDEKKEYIFGNDVEIDDIIWMGPQPLVKDLAAQVGIDNTLPFGKLEEFLKSAVSAGRKVHYLPPYRADNKIFLMDVLGIHPSGQKQNSSEELIRAVVDLRAIKEDGEIAHLEEIMEIAYEMHTTAMKMAVPGVYEREVAGKLEGIALSYGGAVSFPVILTKRGETLHNHYHGNKLAAGDLMLIDAGFESPMHYATDHTRTVPVGGKFSQKQKEIYQLVLDANNGAIEMIGPGVPYRQIHLQAARIITRGLIDLGLMKGDPEEAVKAGAHAMFFPHGLGHMMGLDVHDMEDLGENLVGYDRDTKRSDQFGTAYLRMGRQLKPGFVLTSEPGIYFIPALIDKWYNEKINHPFINFDKVNQYRDFGGIRLEDDILVTENGCRNMGNKRIPITVDEIEAITGKGL